MTNPNEITSFFANAVVLHQKDSNPIKFRRYSEEDFYYCMTCETKLEIRDDTVPLQEKRYSCECGRTWQPVACQVGFFQ